MAKTTQANRGSDVKKDSKLPMHNPNVDRPAIMQALCRDIHGAAPTDQIYWFGNASGDPEGMFPKEYKKLMHAVYDRREAFMKNGVQLLVVSSKGNQKEGGSIQFIPGSGNTLVVLSMLNAIRDELKQAGVNAISDPDYACPNLRDASRAIRIDIPPYSGAARR